MRNGARYPNTDRAEPTIGPTMLPIRNADA